MATRGNKAKKMYVLENDEQVKSWQPKNSEQPGVKFLEFQFANGTKVPVKLEDFPQEMQIALAFHGAAQKLGDSYASDETVADAYESFMGVMEALQNGDWIGDRTAAGPRLGLLAEAIAAAKTNAGTPDTKEAALERLKSKPELRKTAINNKAVAQEYERIKLERQQAKFAEAQKAMEGQTADLSAL